MLDEIDALSDDLLRSVLGRLGPSKLSAVGETAAALRAALEVTTNTEPVDRHAASISSPRSSATLRGRRAHPPPACTEGLNRMEAFPETNGRTPTLR